MTQQNELEKMIPEHECDQNIIKSVPNYDAYTVFPNKYGAWIQGAQWERNRQRNIPTRELLQIEFRYLDEPSGHRDDSHRSKTITIGVYETIEQAVKAGNEVLDIMSKVFEVREKDRFQVKGLFGRSHFLVSNCCYPTRRIEYFASITHLVNEKIEDVITEVLEAADRYEKFKKEEEGY